MDVICDQHNSHEAHNDFQLHAPDKQWHWCEIFSSLLHKLSNYNPSFLVMLFICLIHYPVPVRRAVSLIYWIPPVQHTHSMFDWSTWGELTATDLVMMRRTHSLWQIYWWSYTGKIVMKQLCKQMQIINFGNLYHLKTPLWLYESPKHCWYTFRFKFISTGFVFSGISHYPTDRKTDILTWILFLHVHWIAWPMSHKCC